MKKIIKEEGKDIGEKIIQKFWDALGKGKNQSQNNIKTEDNGNNISNTPEKKSQARFGISIDPLINIRGTEIEAGFKNKSRNK
ncbi:MAG: hypothetical protein N2169_02150 [bacterium]|nr:hypothetical protein [bacterium]